MKWGLRWGKCLQCDKVKIILLFYYMIRSTERANRVYELEMVSGEEYQSLIYIEWSCSLSKPLCYDFTWFRITF